MTARELLLEWVRSRRRRGLLLMGIAAVAVYEAARAWYRPFVYSAGVNDFHIADTLGNSLGTIATMTFFASVFGRTHGQAVFVLRASAIAVAFYELLHPLLGKPIDPFDVFATVVSAVATDIGYRLLCRRGLA